MLNRNTYASVSGVIFSAIALLHALRIIYGWPALIGGWTVPMWVSWTALIISGYLAFSVYRLKR
ncbi:MAG: hypothetical protein HY474_01565 [Candidatus Sungbacteria bacterium]|uniref:Uncharacterized protein n=1 Tax=Candidatus Sungiibacteriota bacterium TaxID=2750080 RepID=A0A933DTU7_9BACT|nr:hypothetical protein [Candidatus Sungbacteria bacterium]